MIKPELYALLKSYEALLLENEKEVLLKVIQSTLRQAETKKDESSPS